ncbi:dephospho-CoA kinase [Viridibacillus sp. FSL R5-0477]|uniref:Dephospho-CoA kinase n=1 Tax=Viridibacillus arenosi FSL R5-213 TaxID=1227360 RepID=W4ERF6_9BACL|nr:MULTISPECIES: dephospho-CoA kinase [Viridibacillus]ETT82587.1 dephospho-CoA kinase [Viridibacillus arenosi FSL R5-213]OMC85552.1 dephospho-CoA kinase [Viridibacillus sp. FSL H8-0123]OMC87174.1 dephospho-CoA kinase [Viridibacillus sp. FSL H7-0596]OMC92333.1 dephospho-CoA kinase [Viridibacillus arenosi]
MIIGLTGSIASGKSTVAEMLKELHLPIIDADLVARVVVEPGTETLKQIVEAFGEEVLLDDGTLDRPKLGSIIFHEPAARKTLNDIIHPAIRQEMLRQRDELLENGSKDIVMDIPLLFESRLQHFVEKILVVTVTEETQLKRLMERNNLSEKEAMARISSQLPLSEKEKGADAVIYNNNSLESTREQLYKILGKWNVLK